MLAIKVETENWQTHDRIPAARLRDLVHRIGGEGDHFLVVQRVPDIPDIFFQVWHEPDGPWEVEHRAGPDSPQVGTELADPERVAELTTRWARQEDGWDAGIAWMPLATAPAEDVPEPEPEVRAEIEVHVRKLLRGGYDGRARLTEAAEEWLVDGDKRPVSTAQAGRMVDRLWLERLAEQETWTDVTDPERIEQAFAFLEESGVVARENFTDCRSCGLAEIGAETRRSSLVETGEASGVSAVGGTRAISETEGAKEAEETGDPGRDDGADETAPRGFVFFHSQGTESAAAGRGLTLYYGGFDGTTERTVEIGHEVVAALARAGLTAEWNGSPGQAITLDKLDWRKRLTG